MDFAGPRPACLALDSTVDDIGNPIVDAIRNTRSLTDEEIQYLTSVVNHTLENVYLGEKMSSVRSYIHRPVVQNGK